VQDGAPRILDLFDSPGGAATYIGISASKFDELVTDGRMPQPKRIDGRKVWDVKALDRAFEALPEDGEHTANPWDHAA
jgi:hypothetical protein